MTNMWKAKHVFPVLIIALTWGAGVLYSQAVGREPGPGPPQDPFQWTVGYSLIVTTNRTIDQANQTVDYINSLPGGQVALVVSPRMMLGWVPADYATSVVGKHGVVAVHARPVTPAVFRAANLDEEDTLKFFNEVASGAWRAKKKSAVEHHRIPNWPADGLLPPPDSTAGASALSGASPSPGNSDMMVGRVSLNAIFVESNGAIDPNLYTWTCADLTTIVGELAAGNSFWSSRALNYGVPLTFLATYYRPAVPLGCAGTATVLTGYEPVLHASSSDSLWIMQIMGNLGAAGADKFARTNAFNTARRTATNANWATTTFIGYNPAPAATTFTNGYFAYAYRSGHYSQLLFRNDGWSIGQYDLVHAHETGHLFGAFDQYASSGCGNCFTSDAYSKLVINGNCLNCNVGSVPSMMRNNEVALDGYTPGQLGWGVDINWVRTSSTTTLSEKTNWIPGQPIRYWVNLDVPGRDGECVRVRSRWYRQFQGNLTESEAFDQACLITSGGNRNIWLDRTVPAGAAFGEASLAVQFELVYGVGTPPPNWYGKGIRSNSRGRFFVLTPAARSATLSAPTDLGEPQADPPPR